MNQISTIIATIACVWIALSLILVLFALKIRAWSEERALYLWYLKEKEDEKAQRRHE